MPGKEPRRNHASCHPVIRGIAFADNHAEESSDWAVDGKWRLNLDGSRDSAFFTGDDGAGVSAAGLLPNGDLLVTGDFAAFEQWPRPCLVRLLGGDAPAAGFFEFVEASSYANEDAGPALVRVRRGGATNEAATVEYATADITAKAGGDSIASRNIKDRGIDPTKSATS